MYVPPSVALHVNVTAPFFAVGVFSDGTAFGPPRKLVATLSLMLVTLAAVGLP
jgi:hypothetical protein